MICDKLELLGYYRTQSILVIHYLEGLNLLVKYTTWSLEH